MSVSKFNETQTSSNIFPYITNHIVTPSTQQTPLSLSVKHKAHVRENNRARSQQPCIIH